VSRAHFCFASSRPGRVGGVPHAEDAHGDGDDQVSLLATRPSAWAGPPCQVTQASV
jgi:hypothetical protein